MMYLNLLTRDIKQSSLDAGYSHTYSKSKAYELIRDTKIQTKIQELETHHHQEHFKKLSLIANTELENILTNSENDSAKLRAIELVYKLSGTIQDERISLNINNINATQNKPKTINDLYLDDFYEDDVKKIINDSLEEFDKESPILISSAIF